MMKDPLVRVLILLYAIGLIVTFGHVWAHFPDGAEDIRLERAFFSALAWPLYWSGWFWSR